MMKEIIHTMFIGEAEEQKLVGLVEDLIEMTWDSRLEFKTKQKYVHDIDFSLYNIIEAIETMCFEKALDYLGGIRASFGIGIKFIDTLNDLVNKIEDLL